MCSDYTWQNMNITYDVRVWWLPGSPMVAARNIQHDRRTDVEEIFCVSRRWPALHTRQYWLRSWLAQYISLYTKCLGKMDTSSKLMKIRWKKNHNNNNKNWAKHLLIRNWCLAFRWKNRFKLLFHFYNILHMNMMELLHIDNSSHCTHRNCLRALAKKKNIFSITAITAVIIHWMPHKQRRSEIISGISFSGKCRNYLEFVKWWFWVSMLDGSNQRNKFSSILDRKKVHSVMNWVDQMVSGTKWTQ